MPVAYTLFFTAVGIMVGAWFRKALLALAITFAVFVVCLTSFANWIRPHYMTPVTVTAPMGPGAVDAKIPVGSWVLAQNIVDKNGNSFNSFNLSNMPAQCRALIEQSRSGNGKGFSIKAAPGKSDPIDDCLNRAGYHQIAKYQPGYRYWDFQEIESGIYLGLTAAAVAAAYWLVLKRDA
jgi:hypothetical protein